MKIGTLFSGIGGVDCGAKAAGLELTWGIEIDPKAAAIANQNLGDHVRVADILTVDPALLPCTDVLHASPPCPNFSVAKAGGEESEIDIALACKVAQFITVQTPRIFTLENVWGYRKSQSWGIIAEALSVAGYWTTVDNVNAADFGVSQTRKRMIVRAVREGFVPMLPQPEPWIGWYEAIEDLIPSLPETEFAPWQLAQLPDEIKTWLIGNQSNGGRRDVVNASSSDQPVKTIMASNAPNLRAFVVDGENGSGPTTVRNGHEPIYTLSASQKSAHRAWLQHGRVVKITVPCLMRFQTFPDWYIGATARGIGNAVPSLMYQKIIEQLFARD